MQNYVTWLSELLDLDKFQKIHVLEMCTVG